MLPTTKKQDWLKLLNQGVNQSMDIQSEILAEDEICAITGFKLARSQINWLVQHGWHYELTGARRPIVGRVYARLKLAGVTPSETNVVVETWTLDLSKVS